MITHKIAALAAHKTQFSVKRDMFPQEMLRDLFGQEYFVRVIPPPQLETGLL